MLVLAMDSQGTRGAPAAKNEQGGRPYGYASGRPSLNRRRHRDEVTMSLPQNGIVSPAVLRARNTGPASIPERIWANGSRRETKKAE